MPWVQVYKYISCLSGFVFHLDLEYSKDEECDGAYLSCMHSSNTPAHARACIDYSVYIMWHFVDFCLWLELCTDVVRFMWAHWKFLWSGKLYPWWDIGVCHTYYTGITAAKCTVTQSRLGMVTCSTSVRRCEIGEMCMAHTSATEIM